VTISKLGIRKATWIPARGGSFCAAAWFVLLAGGLAAQGVNRDSVETTVQAAELKLSSGGIEYPEALFPVLDRFFRTETGQDVAPIHILHFGDSHSAADGLTGALRRTLKARFGDGGSGFSFAGQPFAGYRRLDVKSGESVGWHTEGLLHRVADGLLGIGGAGLSTHDSARSVFIDADCDHVEVYYLQQPNGGTVAIFDRDRLLQQFSTAGVLAPGVFKIETPAGAHHFVLKTLDSKPVRIFGWVADKDRGLTYETMAINGAEASIVLRWDEQMMATYLHSRRPDLIVLAYGANEAISVNRPSEYEVMFSKLLERFHRAVPDSAILVLGPPDFCLPGGGTCRKVPGIDQIAQAQMEACRKYSCSYWDTRAHMGGPGAMREWVRSGLAQRDHVHFTAVGYERLSGMIGADLIKEYEFFKKIRIEIAESPL
jgi:lysophospholipase L1-like esterase